MIAGTGVPDIAIFCGRFGSGKTETAINYAIALVEGHASLVDQLPHSFDRVILVDLDIVTPYFRTRERADRIAMRGVDVIAPSVIGQYLDTPAITPEILGAIQQADYPVILDVGGDRQGARALGQFSGAIQQRGYVMHFVVNPYRPFTDTYEGLRNSIAEVEASARLKVTHLVSNPNLMHETRAAHVTEGHAKITGFARRLGLPIAFVCVDSQWVDRTDIGEWKQPVLKLERHFMMSWE